MDVNALHFNFVEFRIPVIHGNLVSYAVPIRSSTLEKLDKCVSFPFHVSSTIKPTASSPHVFCLRLSLRIRAQVRVVFLKLCLCLLRNENQILIFLLVFRQKNGTVYAVLLAKSDIDKKGKFT